MTTEKFLEFNGKKITLVNADGQFFIALKPICEALKVDYNRQFKNLKEDKILSQLCAIQHTVAGDKKQREMVCLPEKYIYGWLFSINSESEILATYKLECYNVLYNHFHLKQAARETELISRTQIDEKIQALEGKLKETIEYEQLENLKARRKAINQTLTAMDNGIYQTSLF